MYGYVVVLVRFCFVFQIRLEEHFQTRTHLFLVMEYVYGQPMQQYLSQLPNKRMTIGMCTKYAAMMLLGNERDTYARQRQKKRWRWQPTCRCTMLHVSYPLRHVMLSWLHGSVTIYS